MRRNLAAVLICNEEIDRPIVFLNKTWQETIIKGNN
jgi:hypothetical protein